MLKKLFKGTDTMRLKPSDVRNVPHVCAHCNKLYHVAQWKVDKHIIGRKTLSHGICPDCFNSMDTAILERYDLEINKEKPKSFRLKI